MLYRPEAFEPLTDAPWDEGRVRDAIRAIVADADEGLRGPKLLWPADAWDGWHGTSPMKNLYVGSAGVLWALDRLRTRGHAETRLDLADLATRNLELFRTRPDFMKGMKLPPPPDSALLTGETGILLVAWRLSPADELASDLLARVHANVDNPAAEVMWGSPGTLIAAHAMLEWTGDARWRDACNESAEALWARRGEDGLWVQNLYGEELRSLTPPHGLVGNVQALLPLLDEGRSEALKRETAAVLARTAVVEDGLANWPPRDRPDLPGPDGQIRVQWCAGAPGIVIAAADYLEEDLLLAGAELPWHTGPPALEKGPGICHGTAGNGYAFLKTFQSTGDEKWLERARRFAVHALDQVERLRAQRGRGRYSLWTGDIGAALYAADCIDGRSEYPVLDYV
ncbi:MAG: LanC-like protein [Gaiellaceae bacterium]